MMSNPNKLLAGGAQESLFQSEKQKVSSVKIKDEEVKEEISNGNNE